jgi:hypothetical protein
MERLLPYVSGVTDYAKVVYTMRRTVLYRVEVATAGVSDGRSIFGLIGDDQMRRTEMSGYEVTMSGEVVVPRLSPKRELPQCDTHPIDSLE